MKKMRLNNNTKYKTTGEGRLLWGLVAAITCAGLCPMMPVISIYVPQTSVAFLHEHQRDQREEEAPNDS